MDSFLVDVGAAARLARLIAKDTLDRLADSVAMAQEHEDPVTGCWPWQGPRFQQTQYGRFNCVIDRKKKNLLAHRAAYELFVDEIPDGLTLDHVAAAGCTMKHCVNFDMHLEPVTIQVNVGRGDHSRNGANFRDRTACAHGHEYTEANTRWSRNKYGWHRRCRQCTNDKAARYRERTR